LNQPIKLFASNLIGPEPSEASKHHEKYLKTIDARKRFVASKRWDVRSDGTHYIKQKGIHVEVNECDGRFGIAMNQIAGKQRFESLLDAKIKVLDLIESRDVQLFLERRRQNFDLHRSRDTRR
jgi:hypothetical protein